MDIILDPLLNLFILCIIFGGGFFISSVMASIARSMRRRKPQDEPARLVEHL